MAFSLTYDTTTFDKPILQALDSTGESTAQHALGYRVCSTDGREWVYVLNTSSDVAAVAGAPAVMANTTTNWVVTPDVSDGALVGVGAYMSVLEDATYGWIQVKGKVVNAPCTDGSNGEVAVSTNVGATVNAKWTTVTVGGTTAETAKVLEAGSGEEADIFLYGVA